MNDYDKHKILKLISENKIKEALDVKLIPFLANQTHIDNATVFLKRLEDLEREEELGAISENEASNEFNDIKNSLIHFVDATTTNAFQQNIDQYQPQFSKSQVHELVCSLNGSIRFYFIFSLVLLLVGIAFLIFGISYSSENDMSTAISLGGGFISSLSGFPIREIILKKERIGVFKVCMLKIEQLANANRNIIEAKKVDDLIWRMIEKKAMT